MLVSYQWLKEFISDLTVSPQTLADTMSTTGIEIEGVDYINEHLKKLVVGQTLSVVDHPDSDHLHVCQVSVGQEHAEEGVLQIVCGAPNVQANQKVIVALPGARIGDNTKIKKGKIRGVVSNGMLCSLEELGFSSNVIPKETENGIFILPADAPVGADIIDYLQLDDAILELSITPNRADALSMYGVAYEVSAIYDQQPVFTKTEPILDETDTVTNYIDVQVSEATACPVYTMQIIKNVTIAPSPLWLQMRLMKIGMRPINNVVDVTNYILMKYGQPLHAFDYQTFGSQTIGVRYAKDGEQLTTLDGQERILSADDMVVVNGDKAVALAGVMGGLDTEITEKTTTVALESALFDALAVRRTSKKYNLRSESSARFEKGINHATILEAAQEAAAMIAQLAGGTIVPGVAVQQTQEAPQTDVAVTSYYINHILGTQLSDSDVQHILARLNFDSTLDGETITVHVPARRWDIRIPADIAEEVARIYGYDKLPSTLPTTPAIAGGLSQTQAFIRQTRRFFSQAGYLQTIGYVLTTPDKAGRFAMQDDDGIALDFPMSEDRSVLRRSLLTGLLDIASYNVARHNTNLALFETGRVFFKEEGQLQPREEEHLALVLTGNASEKTWQEKQRPVDFFDLKGALEAYVLSLGLTNRITYVPVKDNADLHPGRSAAIYLDDQVIGFIGQVHPSVAKQYDLKDTYVLECCLDQLVSAQKPAIVQSIVPKYPSMTRDIALVVDTQVAHADLVNTIKATAGQYLVAIHLFDTYSGEAIGVNKKSLAYRLTFLDLTATLVDEQVNAAMANVVQALQEQHQAVIR